MALTQAQWLYFHSLGDVNNDGFINSKDLALLQAAYMSTPTSLNWNANADLNGDGIVDLTDISICARNQGLNIWAYYGVAKPIPTWVYVLGAVAAAAAAVGIAHYVLKRRG